MRKEKEQRAKNIISKKQKNKNTYNSNAKMPRRRLRGNKQQPSGDRNATRFRAPSSSSSDSSSGNEETETERRPPPLERRLMQRPYTSRLFLPDSISDEDDGPPPLAIRARRDRVPAMERSSEEEEEDCDESSSDIDSPIRAVTLPNRGTSNNENDRRQQQPLANRDGDNDSSNDDDDDDDSDPSSSSLDGELPALIPRPAMYSTSESGGSEDEEDEDSEADSDDYDDDDDDDDDVLSLGNSCGSDLSPPPLLDPQMSTDFSTEGSDSDRDGSGRWQIFDGRRLEKGDFCLYKLANDKVWTQGVVTKVEVKERVPTPIRIHRPARKFCRRIDYHIHPLDSEEGGTPLLPPFIAKDPNNGRVLKYKEGDSVLVNVAFEALPPLEARAKGMEENKTYWEEAVIEKVWPSEQYPPVAYRIKLSQFPLANAIFKKEEDLRSIRPYDQTLRFDRTTRVQVRTKTGEWKVGTIIGRHYTPEGVTEPYAPYRVMLDGNEAEPSGCVPVFHDTVSHIRCIGEEEPSPRALLEEGLQQNAQLIFYRELLETQSPRCNIEQLVRDYCPEFWIAKAIEYGNYVALWWMEQDLKIDLNRYLDIDPQQPKNKEHYFFRGRGLLHCLVDSPNSRKFFDTWAAISREFHGGILEDSGTPGVLACLTGKNDEKVYATATTMPPRNALTRKDKDGRTFMHCLALRGDIRALSIIADVDECDNLQQHLWELVSIVNEKLEPLVAWPDDNGKTAADLARSSGRHHIAAILDRFAAFCCVHALSKTLQSVYPSKKKIKNIVSLYSKAKDRAILSRRDLQEVAILQDLKKYSKKYPEKYFCSIEKVCLLLAQTGNLPVLKWLYVNAGASLAVSPSEFFGSSTLPVETTADAGEFSSKQTDKTVEPLDIVACAVHGCPTEWKHKPLLGEEDNELLGSVMDRDYWGFIMGQDSYKGFTSKEKWSGDPRKSVSGASSKLVKFLKDKKSSTYVGGIMKEFKLSLIQDDKDLPRRLEVLQWLVSKLGLKPPNVNDVLRWRQNGVLKWMVRGKYIDLSKLSGSIAEIVHFVNSSREQRLWLRVPESTKLALAKLSVGEMLCFLAVEFDDLQSLDYLIKVQGIAASVWFQGWNLLQVSAHYGRREIGKFVVLLRLCLLVLGQLNLCFFLLFLHIFRNYHMNHSDLASSQQLR